MGHVLKIKCVDSRVNVHILSSTSVPFTFTTVQVPNLALKHTKRITVQRALNIFSTYSGCFAVAVKFSKFLAYTRVCAKKYFLRAECAQKIFLEC
jgi:hypothetical protein